MISDSAKALTFEDVYTEAARHGDEDSGWRVSVRAFYCESQRIGFVDATCSYWIGEGEMERAHGLEVEPVIFATSRSGLIRHAVTTFDRCHAFVLKGYYGEEVNA